VLASIRAENGWLWFAGGKHPVVRDFFTSGRDHPIFRAFCEWVEKGYQVFTSMDKHRPGRCLWRFWAKGAMKHGFVCGLIKDSSDLLGRPYPLLVMGTGPLEGWEDHWDLLALACERTWSHLEYFSSKKHQTLGELTEDLQSTRPPDPRWDEWAMSRDALLQGDSSEGPQRLGPDSLQSGTELMAPKNGKEILVPLRTDVLGNLSVTIDLLQGRLRAQLITCPSAVFMGGSPEQSYLASFVNALGTKDFLRLWAVCA
jgi:type VI secretion system protein VasJ